MNDINNIVRTTRKTGNTTWILKSAIINPKCIIVSNDSKTREYLKHTYFKMLEDTKNRKTLYTKLINKLKTWIFKNKTTNIKNDKYPVFMTVRDNFSGLNLPVIFDNSCF